MRKRSQGGLSKVNTAALQVNRIGVAIDGAIVYPEKSGIIQIDKFGFLSNAGVRRR
jgi:hypothetical protein